MKNIFKQSDEEKNRIRGLHLTESQDKRITSILNEQETDIHGNKIYRIPGDRTWEYVVSEGNYWYTRKQGTDKWISLGKTGDKKWLQARCKLDKDFPQARPDQESCQDNTEEQRPDKVWERIEITAGGCKCKETTDPSSEMWYKTEQDCISACSGVGDKDVIEVDGDDWYIDIDISPEDGRDCDKIKACLKYAANLEQNLVNKGRWLEFIDCMRGEHTDDKQGCEGCPDWVNAGPYIRYDGDSPREPISDKIQACIDRGCTDKVY